MYWIMHGDQPNRRYHADTSAAYAPGVIIDAIAELDSARALVTGRFAGRYVGVGKDYVEEPGRYPDTILIERLRFRSIVHH